ncbi:glycosyltransferase family 2 protein [Pseudoduganella umbonata]|uniref:Glycosyltransferase n=1 Tax=Pseudoduganella umbonata TaxID=864828 RepID=A0A4P8HRU7_9BURK|nr:glycosyltransferase [Pseudoduganella umbonata]MBB3222341.1 glycosyltransferase involved in cell wall biosynthesis [Pseudoduganella umbonata]QCP12557.1 glycosyltransferase [Pseudoduganella umbonata]
MTDTTTAFIDVLMCTYRRPELLVKALDGIERAAAKVGKVRVVVVDNDAQQSAREPARLWASSGSLAVTYLTQPLQNISLTRNVALDNATAQWIALIDDDEVPDENWLSSLLETAARYEADVVFAPVIAEFDNGAPEWARQGTLFQRKRFPTGTVIPLKENRTSNVLMRGERLSRDAFRFDPELGLSGGEDSEFFARLDEAGYRMVWCDEACVREWTPLSRTTKTWVLKRAFRIGSVEAYNQRRFQRFGRASLEMIKAAIFMIRGTVLALCWAPVSPPRAVFAMWQVAFGAGVFYGIFAGPYLAYRTVTSDVSRR